MQGCAIMPIADEIKDRLTAAFAPERLEIVDDSESHRGHGGWREGGETHFNVLIRATTFAPMSRIDRHRAIHKALGSDLVSRIHALALDIG
jgi:BolA family transcriptional regulator, general stress-responsive regulator